MVARIQSGHHFVLVNAKARETAMDLSGEDNRSVIGYPIHRGRNQQWEFHETDGGWHIKNGAHDLYLGLDGGDNNGARLVAKHDRYLWHVWTEDHGYIRISVPNTQKSVDLSDHGNPRPGNPIEIWGKWEGLNQLWIPESV